MAGYPNQEGLNLLNASLDADNTSLGDNLAYEGMSEVGDGHSHNHAEGSGSGQAIAMQFVQAAALSAHLVAPHAAAIHQIRSSCNCTDSSCANGRQNAVHAERNVPADTNSPMARFSDIGYDSSPYWS
jgi:hypothetical protein